MKIEEMIAEVQKELGVAVDGRAGPETWSAIYAHFKKKKSAGQPLTDLLDTADPRSEKIIATLLPEVRPLARALIQKAKLNGVQIKILSGLRSYEEQNDLYAQGRTKPGKKITNARGGYSNHNFGIAFDIGVFEGSTYLSDSPKYKAVGVLGMELGLEWGGNWKTIVDQPHFQLRPSWATNLSEKDMLAELRNRKSSGKAVYV